MKKHRAKAHFLSVSFQKGRLSRNAAGSMSKNVPNTAKNKIIKTTPTILKGLLGFPLGRISFAFFQCKYASAMMA
jgi:hypothetical protein